VFEILWSAVEGPLKPIQTKKAFAACVVMAAEGYPEKPVKGSVIEISDLKDTDSSYFIYSGVKKSKDQWTVNGGRVMGAVGIATTKDEALKKAYSQSDEACWPGLQKRTDIGTYF
jgi:phosphoribosylamine--glycine ligase